ncbi:phenylalanine--tRNA ligase subunit beta [Granulicella cerasi]|uniref:Phenylalanine--tRNA ligase beta subunit n=1 Tax=Granulicella cerasi TaxID=741063 RepID=A0ABW1ZAH7_9BACT|nr:phenylalanine--tRNA ligase subunit beta [Granulicella cerasi]
MNLITPWIRSFLPELPVSDRQLAEDLTLRGIAVEGEFPFADGKGTRFEMDITTNRVDAMNHYGVAREVAAIYNVPLKPLTDALAAPVQQSREGAGYPVRIEAEDLCGRFTTRVIRGVTVKPASGLIAEYFAALGQKPISGPVDVTNFGWLAMGQPTHVFDLDKIEGAIVVRRAKAGEKLRLLDGTEKVLVADDLVVADEKKALGLAGVMGGWDSRVTEETKNILVEAAWFEPATIRASSRRHGLHTDASHRFERGADFNAAPVANALITRLVLEQAGGEVEGPLVDVTVPALAAKTADRAPIALRVKEVQRHLGTTLDGSELSAELITRYMAALGCVLTPTGAAGEFTAKLPSWRLDLEREIDLIEEVARVYGYNRFADTLPTFAGEVVDLPHAEQEAAIRTTLRALGFSEAITSTFVSAEAAALFASAPAVPMGNPLSEEAGMLRPALTANMTAALALNLNRDVEAVRLFELGTIFLGSTAEVREQQSLSLGLTGNARATALYTAADALFYEAKGAIEAVLAKFAGTVSFSAENLPSWIEAGRGANALLDGKIVASFGELNAAEAQRRKLKQTCVLAEVAAQTLLETPLRKPVIRDLSRFQSVARDFSFVFPDSVQWSAVSGAIEGLQINELTSVTPGEIFRDAKGKAVAAGSYSLLVRVSLQSPERTLTEEEISGASEKIVATLKNLGGTQRA